MLEFLDRETCGQLCGFRTCSIPSLGLATGTYTSIPARYFIPHKNLWISICAIWCAHHIHTYSSHISRPTKNREISEQVREWSKIRDVWHVSRRAKSVQD